MVKNLSRDIDLLETIIPASMNHFPKKPEFTKVIIEKPIKNKQLFLEDSLFQTL